MSTRLSKAATQALADRLNDSVRLRAQYSNLLNDLDTALNKLNEAQDRVQEKRQALAAFLGVSSKATLGDLEHVADALKKMRKKV